MFRGKKSELFRFFTVPELLHAGPWFVSLVVWLADVLRAKVEVLLTIKAMVQSGLLVV
jgi:hypothetical protein